MGRRRKGRTKQHRLPELIVVDLPPLTDDPEPKTYVDVPTDGDLWVSRWGEYAVIIDRSKEIIRYGLSEALEAIFDDEPILDFDTENDHLVVEARAVRFLFKDRVRRMPLKQFLEWWDVVPS